MWIVGTSELLSLARWIIPAPEKLIPSAVLKFRIFEHEKKVSLIIIFILYFWIWSYIHSFKLPGVSNTRDLRHTWPAFFVTPHAVLFSGVRSSEVDLAAPPPSSYDL